MLVDFVVKIEVIVYSWVLLMVCGFVKDMCVCWVLEEIGFFYCV